MHRATVHGIRARRSKAIDNAMSTRFPRRLFISPQLTNMLGFLGLAMKKRLRQVHNNPPRFWDRDHGIVLGHQTLWQLVVQVDPTFPKCGPTYSGGVKVEDWERFPTPQEIEQALLLAAPAGEQ